MSQPSRFFAVSSSESLFTNTLLVSDVGGQEGVLLPTFDYESPAFERPIQLT